MMKRFTDLYLFLFLLSKQILLKYIGKTESSHPDKTGLIRFYCVKCNFRKPNFSFNIITLKWKCWVCGFSGIGYLSLLKHSHVVMTQTIKLKITLYKHKIKKYFNVLIKDYNSALITLKKTIFLPKLYITLKNSSKTIKRDQALKFLHSRNITNELILLYLIGYCLSGPYSNRVIFPSYDSNSVLNYFISRSFDSECLMKYKNPNILKNMIFYLNRINWNLPVILCLGVLDAIAVRYNAIPLITSSISQYLLKLLIRHNQTIYLLLDGDAKAKGLKIVLKLKRSGLLNVYNIVIDDLKLDASSLGHIKIWEVIQNLLNKLEVTLLSIFLNKLYKNLRR